ncbi:MAG: extracellular solute-binding protein [Clostridia bacterium]|nr:extracellular solute-binding protein [Clostridia bacterium]
MKNSIRIVSLLLSLLMFTSAFVSCKKEDGGADTGTNNVSAGTQADVDLLADLPTGSYGGYEFRIMTTSHNWAITDMTGGIGTDQFSQATYERNVYVSEKLGIKITQEEGSGGDLDNLIRIQVQAGTDEDYDVFWHALSRVHTLSQEGCMYDLTAVDEINLSKPWWYSEFNDAVHISQKRYALVGSINSVYYAAINLCAFNKSFLEQVDKDIDLFEVYTSGKWTWETMYQLMTKASQDVDGDGERKAADDKFGLAIHSNNLQNFLLSANELITEKDKDGLPVYVGPDEGYINTWEYVVDKISDPNLACIPGITNGYSEYSSKGGSYLTAFNGNRALFLLQGAGSFAKNRDSGVDYGLIGFPKPDESSEYYSPIYYGLSAMCIPSVTKDIHRTGTIVENLCAYSYGTVDKAYIESVLYYKYAKDGTSVECIEKAFACGNVDIAWVCSWAKIGGTIQSAFQKRNKDVVSLFKGEEDKIKSAIEKMIIFSGR